MPTFEELLQHMPAIAKAVNQFSSPDVQRQAFEALHDSLTGERSSGRATSTDSQADGPSALRPTKKQRRASATTEGKAEKPRRKTAGAPKVVQVDFRPSGVTPFDDFWTPLAPKSDQEKLLVAVYWLQHEAKISGVGYDQVYTAFKHAKWKVPANIRNALQLTANKKSWLNTADGSDLQTTVIGDNFVEHDLPKRAASAGA